MRSKKELQRIEKKLKKLLKKKKDKKKKTKVGASTPTRVGQPMSTMGSLQQCEPGTNEHGGARPKLYAPRWDTSIMQPHERTSQTGEIEKNLVEKTVTMEFGQDKGHPEGAVGGLMSDLKAPVHGSVSQKKGHQDTPLPPAGLLSDPPPPLQYGAPGVPNQADPLGGRKQTPPDLQQITEQVQRGFEILSEQIFVQGKATAQQTQVTAQQTQNDIALKSDDAASVRIHFQHLVLQHHQSDLEENMKPSDALLDALVMFRVITPKDQRTILRDIGPVGKVKRILVLVNAFGEQGPKKLVDALKQSGCHGNGILAELVEETLKKFHQQPHIV